MGFEDYLEKMDISKWDVSNVKDMSFMFTRSKFNGDISKWKVRKVKYMDYMFSKCPIEEKYKPKFK
jgi:surface protein